MTLVLTLKSDRLIYKLHPELVHQVEQLLFSKGATNCSNRWLAQGMAAEINFDGIPEDAALESVELFLERVPVDKNIQKNINRRKKMLVADMDSTILQIETLDEIVRSKVYRDLNPELCSYALPLHPKIDQSAPSVPKYGTAAAWSSDSSTRVDATMKRSARNAHSSQFPCPIRRFS